MFKNLMLYRLPDVLVVSPERFMEGLQASRFAATLPTQESSLGWVPPRLGKDDAEMLEIQGQSWLFACQRERRLLPGSIVKERLEALCRESEKQTGRKPGTKARKDLKEQARFELLPNAFAAKRTTHVWIAWDLRILAIATTSASEADEIISLLIKSVEGLSVAPLSTQQAPGTCMAAWMQDGVMPEHLSCDRDCELRAVNEHRSVVRYTRHNLDIEAVRQHLAEGMLPSALAMTYADRVSFVLTDTLLLKKIQFLDLAFEGANQDAGEDQFVADFALAAGEISSLLAALVHAFGGAAGMND